MIKPKNSNNSYYKLKQKFKKAFTLTEIIVATFISAIILSFVYVFLNNVIFTISDTKNDVKSLSSVYDFINKLNNYNNIYSSWTILVDNTDGNDLYLMKDITWETWVLIWAVRLSENKINVDNTIYENNWLGFRRLSANELQQLSSDITIVNDMLFHEDQIFKDINIQDLQFTEYNSWSVVDIKLTVDLNYKEWLLWEDWASLPKESLKTFNIDF